MEDRGFQRRFNAVKHNNNNTQKLPQCATNGLSINTMNYAIPMATPQLHETLERGNGLANVQIPGLVPRVDQNQPSCVPNPGLPTARKNSKPSIFGVLRQNSTQHGGGEFNKGASYIQNTPNIHLYGMESS